MECLRGARRVGGIASQPLGFLGVPDLCGPPRLHSPQLSAGNGGACEKGWISRAGWDPRGGVAVMALVMGPQLPGLERVLARRTPRRRHREPAVGLPGCSGPLRPAAPSPLPTAAAREAWTRGASEMFVSPLTREAPPPRAKGLGNSRMLLRMILG